MTDISFIDVLTHSSIRLDLPEGMVYADPFRVPEEFRDASLILVTHDHFDHFSPDDIKKVMKKGTVLIVPESLKKQAAKAAGDECTVTVLEPGRKTVACGMEIEAVPAYNLKKRFHPKRSGWSGYIIGTSKGRIYIAGDTDATPEAKDVRCDIAIVPVGGTYTMDAAEASGLVNWIRPKAAVPTHYGSVAGSYGDGARFCSLLEPGIFSEIRMRKS